MEEQIASMKREQENFCLLIFIKVGFNTFGASISYVSHIEEEVLTSSSSVLLLEAGLLIYKLRLACRFIT